MSWAIEGPYRMGGNGAVSGMTAYREISPISDNTQLASFCHASPSLDDENYCEGLSQFEWKIAKMISENASKRTRNSGLRSSTGICVSASQA